MKPIKISYLWLLMLLFLQGSLTAKHDSNLSGQLVSDELPTFSAEEAMQNPALLMEYWGDRALPLSDYSDRAIAVQKRLNKNEDALVVYSPLVEAQLPSLGEERPAYLPRNIDDEEITPYTWKWIKLELLDKRGEPVSFQIRRPNWWLLQEGAHQIGNKVHFDLAELEVNAFATVTHIWPSQIDTRLWDENREGDYIQRPITGKFKRTSNDVWDFSFDNEDQVLSSTANHPFWSDEHGGWTEIGKVETGESIQLKDNNKAILISKEFQEGNHTVYNFEVFREHHFHVGEMLAYVHNCGGRLGNQATRNQNLAIATELEQRGWTITGGGGKMPEEYLPPLNGGRKGGSYPDITATKDGRTLRINTVDTRSSGRMTSREARNAARIRQQTPGDHLLTIPKN